jgi:hypothetical protein
MLDAAPGVFAWISHAPGTSGRSANEHWIWDAPNAPAGVLRRDGRKLANEGWEAADFTTFFVTYAVYVETDFLDKKDWKVVGAVAWQVSSTWWDTYWWQGARITPQQYAVTSIGPAAGKDIERHLGLLERGQLLDLKIKLEMQWEMRDRPF